MTTIWILVKIWKSFAGKTTASHSAKIVLPHVEIFISNIQGKQKKNFNE